MKSLFRLPLYVQIMVGLALGLAWGLASAWLKIDPEFTINFIKPIGTIFVNLLKMIAVPLVLASLILGVASLNDVKKLSRIGGKTIFIYICTTVLAITVGLFLVNMIKPGQMLPEDTRNNLMELYTNNVEKKVSSAANLQEQPILQPLVDMVPENLILAMTDNTKMLQVVFFAIIFGIALIKIPESKKHPVIAFFDGINETVLKLVEIIMLLAPLGVFALIATLIVEIAGDDLQQAVNLLGGLFWYSITVIIGLAIMVAFIYPSLIRIFTKLPVGEFFKGIKPVQLLAFSTSSSNATLPLTMKKCEEELKVPEEISSFVLPLGATINMDGTSLYQGVAAVFIAQALGMDLSLSDQLMILITATLASIGSAGVPGAGMVMLVIVLEAINIPSAGLALIVAVDRILDMCRTVVNVTGDAAVAVLITESEKENTKAEQTLKQEEKVLY